MNHLIEYCTSLSLNLLLRRALFRDCDLINISRTIHVQYRNRTEYCTVGTTVIAVENTYSTVHSVLCFVPCPLALKGNPVLLNSTSTTEKLVRNVTSTVRVTYCIHHRTWCSLCSSTTTLQHDNIDTWTVMCSVCFILLQYGNFLITHIIDWPMATDVDLLMRSLTGTSLPHRQARVPCNPPRIDDARYRLVL